MAAFTLTIDVTASPEAQDSFDALIASFAFQEEIDVLPGIRVLNMALGSHLPSPITTETPTHGTANQHSDS